MLFKGSRSPTRPRWGLWRLKLSDLLYERGADEITAPKVIGVSELLRELSH
jgi:hypothetical protein